MQAPDKVGIPIVEAKGLIAAKESRLGLESNLLKAFNLVYEASQGNSKLKPLEIGGDNREQAVRTLDVLAIANPGLPRAEAMTNTHYNPNTGEYSYEVGGEKISDRFSVTDLIGYLDKVAGLDGEVAPGNTVLSAAFKAQAAELSSLFKGHLQITLDSEVMNFNQYQLKKAGGAIPEGEDLEFALVAKPIETDLSQEAIDGLTKLATPSDEFLLTTATNSTREIVKGLEKGKFKTKEELDRAELSAFTALAASEVMAPDEIPEDEDLKKEWEGLTPGARNAARKARLAFRLTQLNKLGADPALIQEIQKQLDGENLTVEQTAINVGIDLLDQACQARGMTAMINEERILLQTLGVNPSILTNAEPAQIETILYNKIRSTQTEITITQKMVENVFARLKNRQVQGTIDRWLFGTINPGEETKAHLGELFNRVSQKNILQKASKLFSWPVSDWKNGMCLATTLSMIFPEIMASLLSEEGGKRSPGMG